MPSEVTRRGRGRGRAEPALSRERVLAEALGLLDRDGPEALTMRRLADHLGVTPMALYNHVSSKEDLLQGVARRLVAEADFASDDPDWRERIRARFRELRRVCLAHPGAVRLLETLDPAPVAVFAPMEATLAALAEAGMNPNDALRAYFLLTHFTLGQASYERRGPFKGLDPAEAVRARRLRDARFPHVERAAPPGDWDFDRAFEFGLSVILAGLERPPAG